MRLALAAAGFAIATAAQGAPVTATVAEKVVSSDRFPKLTATYPDGVTAHPDLVYSQINGFRPITLDLYTPRNVGGPKPLVIYVHGGGWMIGTSRNGQAFADFPSVLASLAARGYVVASLNYRLGAEAKFPGATEDVDAAIRWLKAHAADYRIDKSRVAIWGGSAGGQLAALAATDCSPAVGEGVESDCVQAAAIWFGVFDIPALPNSGLSYFAGQETKASAVTFLDAADPPFLLVHGDNDHSVPVSQSRDMLKKLRTAGVKATYIEIPGSDHSFIGKTPSETRAYHLRALQATFDFFDATVGRK